MIVSFLTHSLYAILDVNTVCVHSVEYRWADGVKVKKPMKVNAPEYIDRLMSWIEGLLDDESIFPTTGGINTEGSPTSFVSS
jgi:hypothetical protein